MRTAPAEEVGPQAGDLRVGDRVVVPFQFACGRCVMCSAGLQTQCETTQVRERDKGADLFGYSALYCRFQKKEDGTVKVLFQP